MATVLLLWLSPFKKPQKRTRQSQKAVCVVVKNQSTYQNIVFGRYKNGIMIFNFSRMTRQPMKNAKQIETKQPIEFN